MSGPRGLTPTGRVQIGVDKTLLEGIDRVVRGTTGMELSAIKALLGVYGTRPPTSCTMPASGDDEGEEPKEKVLTYSFLATIDPQTPMMNGGAGKLGAGWKWCSKSDVEKMDPVNSHRTRLLTALGMMEHVSPTHLVTMSSGVEH